MSGVTNLEEAGVLNDNVVEMEVLEVMEVGGEGEEMRGGVGAMEVDEVVEKGGGGGGGVVARPAELEEEVLEVREGANDVVGGEEDKDAGAGAGSGGGAGPGMGRVVVLEGLPGGVGDQPGHSLLVEHPHSRHPPHL